MTSASRSLFVAFLGAWAFGANAIPIELDYTAQTAAEFGLPALTITGRVTYDSSAAAIVSFPVGAGTITQYPWLTWDVTINGVAVPIAPPGFADNLEVANDISDSFSARDRFDGVATFAAPYVLGDVTLLSTAIIWEDILPVPFDVPPSALNGNSLPTATSDLAGFPTGAAVVVGSSPDVPSFAVQGNLTSYSIHSIAAVPEPAAAWLVLLGLLAVAYAAGRSPARLAPIRTAAS